MIVSSPFLLILSKELIKEKFFGLSVHHSKNFTWNESHPSIEALRMNLYHLPLKG
jgi:hypothetical protein